MCPVVLDHEISQLSCEIEGRKNTIYDLPPKGYALAFANEMREIELLECRLAAFKDILNDESGKEKSTADLVDNVMMKSRGF